MRASALGFACVIASTAGCVGHSLDPSSANRNEILELPWRVHCETEKTYALDLSAMPGVYAGRWIWGQDRSGETIFLQGELEDGFFRLTDVKSISEEQIPATQSGLRETCLNSLEQDESSTLARVLAARDSRDINVPIVFPEENAAKHPVTRLVLFGDSLTDSGRLKHRLHVFPGSPYWLGRFSNGPAWPDYLQSASGLAIQNNAYGGASVERPPDLDDGGLISYAKEGGRFFVSGSLGQQTDVYLEETLTSVSLVDAKHTAFLIWGGANDYISKEPVSGLITTFLDEPKSELGYQSVAVNTVAGLASEVRTLYSAGARRFVLVNLPDLGRTPIVLQNESYVPSRANTSDTGRLLRLSQRLSSLSEFHNQALATAVQQLNQELVDATVLLVDSHGLTQSILDERLFDDPDYPFDYGFSQNQPEQQLSYKGQQVNLPQNCYSGIYLGSFLESDTCENDERATFWDVIHPGTYAHCWQAYQIGSVLVDAGWIAPMVSMEDYRKWCGEYLY
jgi:phospholipase/lecithinase/hemolysin